MICRCGRSAVYLAESAALWSTEREHRRLRLVPWDWRGVGGMVLADDLAISSGSLTRGASRLSAPQHHRLAHTWSRPCWFERARRSRKSPDLSTCRDGAVDICRKACAACRLPGSAREMATQRGTKVTSNADDTGLHIMLTGASRQKRSEYRRKLESSAEEAVTERSEAISQVAQFSPEPLRRAHDPRKFHEASGSRPPR